MSELNSLNKAEVTRLLAAVDGPRNKAIIMFGIHHGFRSSEIAALTMSDIDLQNGLLTVRRGKGSETNVHKILPTELPVLLAALEARPANSSPYVFISNKGGRLDRSQIFRIFQQAATKAGLHKTKRHYHCGKHTGAVMMLQSGATMPEVQKYFGWRSLATVGRYLAVSDETASQAATRAFA
jgi:integrase